MKLQIVPGHCPWGHCSGQMDEFTAAESGKSLIGITWQMSLESAGTTIFFKKKQQQQRKTTAGLQPQCINIYSIKSIIYSYLQFRSKKLRTLKVKWFNPLVEYRQIHRFCISSTVFFLSGSTNPPISHSLTLAHGQCSAIWREPPGYTGTHFAQSVLWRMVKACFSE